MEAAALLALAVLLISIGSYVSLCNWMILYQSFRYEKSNSTVPFIGGIFLVFGFLLIPSLHPIGWLAFVLDYGFLTGIIGLPVLFREIWSMSPFNLLHELRSVGKSPAITIKLYRDGAAMFSMDHKVIQLGLVGFGGRWRNSADNIFELELLPHGKVLRLEPSGDGFVCRNIGTRGTPELLYFDDEILFKRPFTRDRK